MGNVMGMTEIFVGVIVATIITMRPCFQAVGIKVFDTVSNATNLRSITGGETKQGSRGSRILTLTTASRRDKVDREGFNQIAVTTEIELETRDRSTEDLFDNNMRPTYHPGK